MGKNRLNFYFYGEVGVYDEFSPANICNMEHAPEILFIIASNNPFSITCNDIADLLNINVENINDVLNKLLIIKAVDVKNNLFSCNFPVFLEKDVLLIENYLNDIGKIIGDTIYKIKEIIFEKISKLECSKSFSTERILFHVLCDTIFDGIAFDFLSERNVLSMSKPQPGNRDYIIIGYEDSDLVEKHSNKLLCSSNNYRNSSITFNSFGDSDGSRKDMYRFFRFIQQGIFNASPFSSLNSIYNNILDDLNHTIIDTFKELICKIEKENINYNYLNINELKYLDLLCELQYIVIDQDEKLKVIVPIFYTSENIIINEISDIVLTAIFPIVNQIIDNISKDLSDLTAIKHGVNISEIANELWHQIFGYTNEHLVKSGFVENPTYKKGEGRYLKSILINNIE